MAETALPDFDSLWNYDQPAETEQRFREILGTAEAGNDTAYLLELRTQIARTLGLQRKFKEAHALLDEVESELKSPLPELRRAHVRYLLERGRAYNSGKQKEKALPLFRQAYDEGLAGGFDFYAIDAAHMMAIVTPPAQQLEWNLLALEMCEKTTEPRAGKWRGSLYNNIGWTYHDMGRLDDALDMFERGVEFRAAMGQDGPLRIAKWSVARCLRSLGRVEEALARQQALYEGAMAEGRTDMYVLEEMAECLHALGREPEAKPWFRRAYAELSKDEWLVENEPDRLKRLKDLAQ